MELKTLQNYQDAAKKFNKLSFKNKIQTLMNHKDALIIGADGNWWNVQVIDKEIQEILSETETGFHIENEWGSHEMIDLIGLLGLSITDA